MDKQALNEGSYILNSAHPSKLSHRCLTDEQSIMLGGIKPKVGLCRTQSAPTSSAARDHEYQEELDVLRSKEALLVAEGVYNRRRPSAAATAAPTYATETSTSTLNPTAAAAATDSDRATLVDWLAELRGPLSLRTDTLFLAVSYVDRFLAAAPVARKELQLLGLAALWVAAKMEEVDAPRADEMLAELPGAAAEQLVCMEETLLKALDFRVTPPTSCCFLPYLLALAPLPPHPDAAASARRLAAALLELTLLDTAFAAAPPSHVAAAAAYLGLGLSGGSGPGQLGLRGVMLLSGADPERLGGLVQRLAALLQGAVTQHQRVTMQHGAGAAPQCALFARYLDWAQRHHHHHQQQQQQQQPEQQQLQRMHAAAQAAPEEGRAPAAPLAAGAPPSPAGQPEPPPQQPTLQPTPQQQPLQPLLQPQAGNIACRCAPPAQPTNCFGGSHGPLAVAWHV